MSRPRAGHGWTAIQRNGKLILLMADSHGRWVTTGVASGWPRCVRCRKPEQEMPFNFGLCVGCFFYRSKVINSDQFWYLHKKGYPLAPYNIGEKVTQSQNTILRQLFEPNSNWREIIASQFADGSD